MADQSDDEKNKLEYQYYGIEFKVAGFMSTINIQSYSIIRAPIHKIATFAIVTCEVDNDTYVHIENEIRQNKTVTCTVRVSRVDGHKVKPDDSTQREEIKTLFTKTYYLDYCKSIYESSQSKVQRSLVPVVNFFLVNPSIWYLSNRKRYNALYKNVPAVGALGAIEGWISGDYKDTFNFNDFKIGINPNGYVYEHILARSVNDLMAPINIINTYKVLNEPSYYFFDDFYYTDTLTTNFIPVYFVNLTKQNSFQKLDISDRKWKDFFLYNHPVSILPVTDKANFFSNGSKVEHIIQVDSNQTWKFEPNPSPSSIPNFAGTNTGGSEELNFQRYKFTQSFSFQSEVKGMPNDMIRVYAPEKDSHGSANARYSACSNFYRNQAHAICTFEAERAFIDLLQFNRIYNLEANDTSDFSHIPINIVNTFYKINAPDKFYRHSVKYQTLQFKPNSPDGNPLAEA